MMKTTKIILLCLFFGFFHPLYCAETCSIRDHKRILVTGAAGFIGFHLAQKLHERGDFIIGLDNFNKYYIPQLKLDREKELNKRGITVVHGDICDQALLNRMIEEHHITHIAHMAAQAGVRYSLEQPQSYVHSNIEGFLNILEACRHYKTKLTYASSSSVYGHNTKVPFSEEDRTDTQASFYGVTKKTNELMAYTYHKLFGISATGLRFFTVYGPWGRPDMACYIFAKAIEAGKPIELFNYGQMQRDFTYVDDVVDGIIASIDLEAPYEIFNLGNTHPETLFTFVELLEKHLGMKAEKKLLPMQEGDVLTTYADIKHSQEKLHFVPKVSLDEGLKRFVEWHLSYSNEKKESLAS